MKFDTSREMFVPPDHAGIHEIAKLVAAGGIAVLPIRGKFPANCPNGVYDATTDPAKIDAWPKDITGYAAAVPSDVLVIDVDPRNCEENRRRVEKGQAPNTLGAWLCANAKDIPETSVAYTGGGGWHIWLSVEAGARFPAKLGPKGSGVDVRQYGNYVVMPGSAHYHEGKATGKTYAWYNGGTPVAAAPAWLTGQQRDEAQRSDGGRSPHIDVAAKLPATEIESAGEVLAQNMIDGCKNTACRAFGGWANSRGIPWTDCEAIILEALSQRSDVKDPKHGVAAARWAYDNGVTKGWAELQDSLEEGAGASLELALPDKAGDRLDAALAKRKQAADALAEAEAKLPDDDTELAAMLGEEIDLRDPVPDEVYAVKGFPWQMGVVNALVGYPGSGKSPLVATLIAAWATDTEWLDCEVLPGPVLMICFEAVQGMRRALRRTLRAIDGLDLQTVSFFRAVPGSLHNPDFIAALRRVVARRKILHVVIDTYGSGATGVDANETGFADPLKELEIDHVNVLVLMHGKKGQSSLTLEAIAGTSATAGALKAAVGVAKPDPSSNTFTLNWMRGDNWFTDIHFELVDVSRGTDDRWGLYAGRADTPTRGKAVKETRDQLRDRLSNTLRTDTLPRLRRDATYRPTFEELAREIGTIGARECDTLKTVIAGMFRSGVIGTNKVEGVQRYYPI